MCQLPAEARVPEWALGGSLLSVTRTADELSIVCEESRVPADVRSEKDWVALKMEGPFPFAMTGVLASFIGPLAVAGVSIFSVSTFDTDYVLVKRAQLEVAIQALAAAGHMVTAG